jgi:Na+-transporting NADH:ubiquinone oxidoreductase subunit A
MQIVLKRGLDLHLKGVPSQVSSEKIPVRAVAFLRDDLRGTRPKFQVELGTHVAVGQPLFIDRKHPEIAFTAPLSGKVTAIERSPLASKVLEIARDDHGGEHLKSDTPMEENLRTDIRKLLLKSGLWPAFLTRPFGRIPDPETRADAIFVTAMDTNPLAADSRAVIAQDKASFREGVVALTNLCEGPIYVCQEPGEALFEETTDGNGRERIHCVRFSGPHPAGLAGTHIHHLAPVGRGRVVWQIGYQDVIAIGHLMATGKISFERVVALSGPALRRPRLVRVPLGARLDDLVSDQKEDGAVHVISGSVLSGHQMGYLGRYHTQVSVIPVTKEKSALPFLSRLMGEWIKAPAPSLPLEAFERVMPLDILAVPLLRALSTRDVEAAERLGCLQLVEEDVALLSHVCPSKCDYGPLLRSVLDEIETERR